MNKMSEFPALLYMNMQSENRKPPINLIESIFYVKKTKQIYTSGPYEQQT